jgi:hypothetical protein
MRMSRFLAGLVIFCLSSMAFAQVELRTVLLTGDPLPAVGANVTFDGQSYLDYLGPTINNRGNIAFYCHMNGLSGSSVDGSSDPNPELHDSTSGIITDVSGEFELVARNSDPIPGMENLGLVEINSPQINDAGEILFYGSQGLFVGIPHSFRAAALTGPMVISNTRCDVTSIAKNISTSPEMPSFNSAGTVIARLSYKSSPSTIQAMVTALPTGLEFLARTKADGVTGFSYGSAVGNTAVLNARNTAAFSVDHSDGQGLYVSSPPTIAKIRSTPHELERRGIPFRLIWNIGINNADLVIFEGYASNGPESVSGIWRYEEGKLSLWFSDDKFDDELDSLYPDATVVHPTANSMRINGAGEIAFRATLTGPNLKPAAFSTIWRGVPGSFRQVFGYGMPVPGSPGGLFSNYSTVYCLNRRGDMVVYVRNQGYWHVDARGETHAIAKVGDMHEVRPGDSRKITAVAPIVETGGEDGRARALNDAGQFVFAVKFLDGSTAVMIAQLPD